MKITVVGAGAVGGYFGGRLAAGGADVTLVARGAHLDAIRARGLRINSALGDITVESIKAVDAIAKIGETDLVIVAVKLWDTEGVAEALRPIAARGAAVVSFQNGVHKDEIFRKFIPAASIMGGVCYVAAVIAEPGVIAHTGTMERLVFGEHDGTRSARARALLDACHKAKITAEISDAIECQIWEKFVFLIGLSGTTATIRKPIGPIRENPQTREFLLNVMKEVVAVARAKGVPLREDYAQERLAFIDTLPAAVTSSMHHDLERGNRLELRWLSGGVAELGARAGVPTPLNAAISAILTLQAG